MNRINSLTQSISRLAVFGSLCLVFYSVVFPLTNTDIWWHLTAGREMLQTRAFLFRDVFSVSSYGNNWINLHWLFQILAFITYRLGGISGLVIAKAVLTTFAALVLVWIVPHKQARPLLAAFVLVVFFLMRYQMLARPTIFTLLFIILFLFIIERAQRQGSYRKFWLLIPIQIAWVNLQGLFLLGPIIIGTYLAGNALSALLGGTHWHYIGFKAQKQNHIKPLAWALLGALIACFINPYGWQAWTLPFVLFGRINPSVANIYAFEVSENIPLWMLAQAVPARTMATKILGIVTLASFVLVRKQFCCAKILLFLGFFILANMAFRNVPLYHVVLVAITGLHLASWWDSKGQNHWFGTQLPKFRLALGVGSLALWAVVGKVVYQERTIDFADSFLAPFRYPTRAVEYLKQNPPSGNLFNSVRQGGYLMWQMTPHRLPFIDGRLVLRSRNFFATYLDVLDHPHRFAKLQDQYNLTHALLPISINQRYLGLAEHLYNNPQWHLVYMDASDLVFTHKPQSTERRLDLSDRTTVDSLVQAALLSLEGHPFLEERATHNITRFLDLVGTDSIKGQPAKQP